jgi:DNA-binding CsgD family transcriptional regulator
MISTEELSSLLATLYAAPLEPTKWQSFLEHLCSLTNIDSGYLVGSHPTEGNLVLAGGGLNFDPEVFRLYNEHYGANDPYRDPLMSNPRIGLIQGEDLVTHSTLLESELYNEVLSRYDLEYMNMLSCNCSNGQAELLSLWRSEKHGPLDRETSRLLEMLIPHLQTALGLRTKVAACDASNLFSETALESMSIAAFLVTHKGLVRHMNQRAASCLQSGDGLVIQDGRLTANDSQQNAHLESLILGTASNGKKRSTSIPGTGIRISRRRTQSALQVTVIPAPKANQIGSGESFALVFVSDPSASPRPRSALMQQLYGLTPAEARVADLLLEGYEGREAAQRLGITLETFRFHVKRVLTKTGAHRQTELLRLMLSLPGQ